MSPKQRWKEIERKAVERAYVDIVGGAVQLELAKRATIPLLIHRRGHGAPELLASGVLLRLQGRVFILTAAHVIETVGRHDLCLQLNGEIIRICPDGYLTPLPESGTYVDDPVDAAVLPVPAECNQSFLTRCATLADLHHVDNAYDVAYWVHGFPLKRSSRTAGKLRTDYRCMTIGGLPIEAYHRLKKEPNIHILMERPKRVSTIGGMKEQPAARGMSGCGAWILPAHHGWPLPPKLAGVFIEKAKGWPAFVATSIRVHLDLISSHEPVFEPLIREWAESEALRDFRQWLIQRGGPPVIPDQKMQDWFARKIGVQA